MRPISRITREKLVAAVAPQSDLHGTCRQAREDKRGKNRGIRQRFIQTIQGVVQVLQQISLGKSLLAMIRFELPGDHSRIDALIEVPIFKRDRKGANLVAA